jgi:hypothetical protein
MTSNSALLHCSLRAVRREVPPSSATALAGASAPAFLSGECACRTYAALQSGIWRQVDLLRRAGAAFAR